MNRIVRNTLIAVACLGVGGGIFWSYLAHRDELTAELEGDKPIKNATRVERTSSGETVVKFDVETQQRMDIRTTPLTAVNKHRDVAAYGHLEEDPSLSFILRAPVAGVVRSRSDRRWPGTGETLGDRTLLGVVEPRLAPSERISLGDRLLAAKADLESSSSALTAARAALDRAKILNADDKNVSDRAVQEAETKLAAEQARAKAAGRTVQLIESSLASTRSASLPLEIERGGQVVEVLAHPGESVESGQAMVRVSRFDQLLARVDVSAGEPVATSASTATILPLGHETPPLRGQRIALAAAVDPKTQGQPFLFRITNASNTLRPGLAVTAYLESPGTERAGVIVPRSAVVRQSGKAWVYVKTGPDRFNRREAILDEPTDLGWFTRSLNTGDLIVTTGAQTLFSEEFKSQIQVGDEQ